MIYHSILTFHIIFAGIWLSNFIVTILFRKHVIHNGMNSNSQNLVPLFLVLTNLLGIAGATGILVTGIWMVFSNDFYNFFQFTANHWLTTKQVIMAVLLLLIFFLLMPTAKLVRKTFSSNKPDDLIDLLQKLFKYSSIINWLVLVNFLLAVSHRFYS